MDTTVRTKNNVNTNLMSLRNKVTSLVAQAEDEALLVDIAAMLSGVKRPCTYTQEEFASVLAEADEDYKTGRLSSHEQVFAQYGL